MAPTRRREARVLTVGVEEEFFLLEPDGRVAPAAAAVADDPGVDGQLKPEYMVFQVETASRVCTRLDELRSDLVRLRLLAAGAAGRAGVHLIPVGMPPFAEGPMRQVTQLKRYTDLARQFPWATSVGGACACQVHVGIPDRELATDVLARLRPWLATLLALAGNSPIAAGTDSGWSSRRYFGQLRWPTFRPPQAGAGAAGYDRAVKKLVARGAAIDARSVYFLARLSPQYPTIEVRVADTCLTVEDAVLLAGVARALIATLMDDAQLGLPFEQFPRSRVSADLLSAAQHGMLAAGSGRSRTAVGPLVARLLAKIRPALEASGDAEEVTAGLERLARTGTGADRQRRLWHRSGDRREFVAALADAAVPVAPVV
jgi:carboxylate-amine ligase